MNRSRDEPHCRFFELARLLEFANVLRYWLCRQPGLASAFGCSSRTCLAECLYLLGWRFVLLLLCEKNEERPEYVKELTADILASVIVLAADLAERGFASLSSILPRGPGARLATE